MNSRPEPLHVDALAAIEPDPSRLNTVFVCLSDIRSGKTRSGRPFVDLKLRDGSGTVAGKIWDDAQAAMEAITQLRRGQVVKALFRAETYQGAIQLNVRGLREVRDGEPRYDPGKVLGDAIGLIGDRLCQTLVFDIETVPALALDDAPATVAKAVEERATRNDFDTGMVMGLSPLLGKIVSLAFGDGEVTQEGGSPEVYALVVPPPDHDLARQASYPSWMIPVSESDLLKAFWCLAEHAEVVVSYNGRAFDVPFLIGRSLVHGVPAKVDLLGSPYALRPHLDLYRVVTNGRSLGPSTLDMVCWALGIESPKGVMDGSMVAPTYEAGGIETIAEYNRGDVAATTAVYHRIRDTILRYRSDW
ncbi:MAG: ribonuclease H-like domain-containing protein [Nannocystaceae bacterium]